MKKTIVTYREEAPEYDLPHISGKAYRRKSDGIVFYGGIPSLGKLYFIDGIRLEEPYQEVPEDFELIDIQEDGNSNN